MASTTSVVCVLLLGIFTVADSAAVATTAVACPATYRLDMYVLIDISGSIPETGMPKLKSFLEALVKKLPIGPAYVQIAMGTFNSKFTHLFNLNKYSKSADIIKQLQGKVKLQGMTNLAGALKAIRQDGYLTSKTKGSRDGVDKKLYIFTDGNSDDAKLTIQEANLIRALKIEIVVFTIGVPDTAEAAAIAGGSSNVLSATGFATVSLVLNDLVQHICPATTKPTTTTPKPTTTTPKATTTTPKPATTTPKPTTTTPKATTTTPKPTTTTPKPTTTTPKPTTTTPKPTTTTPAPTTTTPEPTTTTPEPTTTTPEPTTTTPEPTTTTPAPTTKKLCTSAEVDLIVALDSSGSIGEFNFKFNLDFLNAFVDEITIGESQTRLGLFTFGTYPVQALRLTGDIQLIKQAIAGLQYQGSTTETHLVITAALNEYILHGRPGVRKVLSIVTDGLSSSPALTLALAAFAKKFGVDIICVGVGDQIDPNELRNVSSSGTFLFAKDYSELPTLIYSLGQDACNEPSQPQPTPATPQPQPTPATPQPQPTPATPQPQPTPATPQPEPTPATPQPEPTPAPPCSNATEMEVVFLIDSSGSMGKTNFQFNCDLISRYVDTVGISEFTIRVAVITFGTHPRYVFGLTGDVPTIRKGISAMGYQGSTTETHLALEAGQDELKNHGRYGVPYAIVLVTDGISTTPDLTLFQASEIKKSGTNIIVVAVGDLIDERECRSVSSSGTFIYVDQYSNLPNMTASIGQKTCDAASTPVTGDPDNDSDSSSDSSSSDSDEQCAAVNQ